MAARWLQLESNPETMDKFIRAIGVKGVTTADIFGFDDESLSFLPQPHLGVILCFPDFKNGINFISPQYEALTAEGYKNPSKIFFMKQKIINACGTFALFHVLANLSDKIDLGNGPFEKWLTSAREKSFDERSDLLANDADLAAAHDACARSGDTPADDADHVPHHFIALVNIDDTLFEFSGQYNFARPLGPTTQETFFSDVGKEVEKLCSRLESVDFSAIALVGSYD